MARQRARRWWFAALATLAITLAAVLGVQSLGSGAPQPDAATTSHTTYVLTFTDGTTVHFGQLNHLTTEMNVVDYESAGTKTIEHSKHFGTLKGVTLSLARRYNHNATMTGWYQQVANQAEVAYQDVRLTAVDGDGTQSGSWHLKNAWPSKMEITTGAAGNPQLTVTVQADQMSWG